MSERLTYTNINDNIIHQIFGDLDKNKKIIEERFNIELKVNSEGIEIIGGHSNKRKLTSF